MKTVASLLAGTALAVTLLLGGVVVASAVIAPQEDVPRFTGLDVADLWTLTPVRVDPAKQSYERLAPRYGSDVVMANTTTRERAPAEPTMAPLVENVDVMETGAVADTEMEQDAPVLSQAHVSWCQARYRSYSSDDNSYLSYGGELRTCVSPFPNGPEQGDAQTEAMLVQDSTGSTTPVAINSAHAQNCLQRYRSYRAEDNSYQPYGGGPRKQCELRTF